MARVLHSLDEMQRINPGEILVTRTTTPAAGPEIMHVNLLTAWPQLAGDRAQRHRPGAAAKTGVCALCPGGRRRHRRHPPHLVTDLGGPLAHGSIVAREYGIPAVMGVGNATQFIRDGDTITVDGAAGRVLIA